MRLPQRWAGPATFMPLLSATMAACSGDASGVYTLYRSSMAASTDRVHVATFDAREGNAYNRENCETAALLFGAQPGIKVRYWCELGSVR